ncbi:MAG: LLM class flavin-dependent oxidoreductase [Acidimicrobiia bacterium]|nr:LLM class flavin-dependent oxidoreductase [Acidimicrobiia bacterium]
MEFHLFLPQMRMTMETIVDRARAAEAAGFGGIAFMDHLAPPNADGHPMFDAMATAGWVAANTSRLIVGHLVLCDPFRQPAVLAKDAVTLDHASGGRFELGIGSGSVASELTRFGIEVDGKRVDRLAETLDVLKLLWSGEQFDYEGRFHRLQGAQQLPAPTRAIPILIGGAGPRTMELVARHADWWNLPGNDAHRLAELRPRAGGARPSLQTIVGYVADESRREEVTALATRRFGWAASGPAMVVGTAPELVDQLSALADSGVERFYTWFTDFAAPDTIKGFGAEVIGALGG